MSNVKYIHGPPQLIPAVLFTTTCNMFLDPSVKVFRPLIYLLICTVAETALNGNNQQAYICENLLNYIQEKVRLLSLSLAIAFHAECVAILPFWSSVPKELDYYTPQWVRSSAKQTIALICRTLASCSQRVLLKKNEEACQTLFDIMFNRFQCQTWKDRCHRPTL